MELPNAKYSVNRMESFFPNEIGKMQVQGEPLKLPPLNLLSTRSLYNLWHLEKFLASFDGILSLKNLGGGRL